MQVVCKIQVKQLQDNLAKIVQVDPLIIQMDAKMEKIYQVLRVHQVYYQVEFRLHQKFLSIQLDHQLKIHHKNNNLVSQNLLIAQLHNNSLQIKAQINQKHLHL